MKRKDKFNMQMQKLVSDYKFGHTERYIKYRDMGGAYLVDDFADFCEEEIETKPRIKTIKTKEDYKKIYAEYMNSIVKYNADHIFSPKNICEDSWLEFLFGEVEYDIQRSIEYMQDGIKGIGSQT